MHRNFSNSVPSSNLGRYENTVIAFRTEVIMRNRLFNMKIRILLGISTMVLSLLVSGCQAGTVSDKDLVPPIRIVTTTREYDPLRYDSAQQIAKWWSELGLTVKVEPMEFEDMLTRIRRKPDDKDWEAYMLLWSGRVERADPDMFIYSIAHSSQAIEGGNNMGAYKSEEFDKLAEAQRRITDPDLRRTVVLSAQEVLAKDIPFITLFFRYVHSAYRSDMIKELPAMAGEGLFHEWLPYQASPLEPGQEFILKIAGNQEPTSLNPVEATSVWDWKLLRLMYDKLARVDQSFRPVPWAAESIEFVNDRNVKVVLRPGMTFHDGTPVTAKDVKFSFEFVKEQKFALFDAFIKPIEKIDILGTDTIIFTLSEPYAPFVSMTLAQIPILPEHLWRNWADNPGTEIPMVGSGPLAFKSWEKGKKVVFESYEDYFAADDFGIAGLEYVVYGTSAEVVESIVKGECHMTGATLDPNALEPLQSMETVELLRTPAIGFHLLGFNCHSGPFEDPALREAAVEAIDLEYLLKDVLDNEGDIGGVGQSIAPGNPYWRNPSLKKYPFDLEKARKGLEDAGYRWNDEGRLMYPKGYGSE